MAVRNAAGIFAHRSNSELLAALEIWLLTLQQLLLASKESLKVRDACLLDL